MQLVKRATQQQRILKSLLNIMSQHAADVMRHCRG
jgi:hypothetical protein